MANITIKDVAREAGVAVETVSRVLNNRGYISQKTRDKVEGAMKKIGYIPNAFAQGLSKKKMDCIAVIVPHIVHPYFAAVISELEKVAGERGYKLLVHNSGGDKKREKYLLQLCQSSFISGVLLFSAEISANFLKGVQIPVVMVERGPVGNSVNVQCDNAAGGRMAAEHLMQKGCKKLMVISTTSIVGMPGDERDLEFVRVCREAGCEVNSYRASEDQYALLDYHAEIERALSEHPDVDGIFATSDLIAAQVIQCCCRRNLPIPEKVKLVGFDDVPLSMYLYPTLTTIRQPIADIVKCAVDSMEKISEGKRTRKNIVLPVELVERESTADR